MKTGRHHSRHDQELLEQVKAIAKKRRVSVAHLVDQFFVGLVAEEERPRTDEELGVEQA